LAAESGRIRHPATCKMIKHSRARAPRKQRPHFLRTSDPFRLWPFGNGSPSDSSDIAEYLL
jgi:hypothetical protein